MNNKIIIVLTILNLLLFACGASKTATANGGYEKQILFGYTCLTNSVSIWCDPN